MKHTNIFVSKKTSGYIREMNLRRDADRKIRLIGKERARMFIVFMSVAFIVSIPVFIAGKALNEKQVTSLARNEYGEGDRSVTLLAVTEDGIEEKINVNVSERQYSRSEIEELSNKLDEVLWTHILGQNESAENVTRDIVLPDHMGGFPFLIEWSSDRPLLLADNGKINTRKLSEEDPEDEGIQVCLRATLTYKDYKADKYSYVIIRREDQSDPKSIKEMIEDAVNEKDRASASQNDQILPQKIGNKKILFYERSVNIGWIILFLGLVIPVFLTAKKDDLIKKEAEIRRKQIDSDHFRILNQYALYHTAGMSPRSIWSLICEVYEMNIRSMKGNRRYAYEEMTITKKMMDEGMGEIAAYDDFAGRIGSIKYRSFISLIKQSVLNGGESLTEMLYDETKRAQRDRMSLVKTEASEAQTKLLLPMFMMLLVVIVIVCIPAFLGLEV